MVEMSKEERELSLYWDTLEEIGVSTQTILMVTNINGYNKQAFEDMLYVHTGYRSFEQFYDYMTDCSTK